MFHCIYFQAGRSILSAFMVPGLRTMGSAAVGKSLLNSLEGPVLELGFHGCKPMHLVDGVESVQVHAAFFLVRLLHVHVGSTTT
jgi:hypothetical protein